MDTAIAGFAKPKLRSAARVEIGADTAELTCGGTRCAFAFAAEEADAVRRLLALLATGDLAVDDLAAAVPEIDRKVLGLLEVFDRERLLVEAEPRVAGLVSGAQLYREVRRIADRIARRLARSEFHRAMVERRATRAQLIGYALEYFYIVKSAPGLIGPALATASGPRERALLQGFLRSELGHDRFLARALQAAGLTAEELEAHQPLPCTFALCAALGVYARQHPLSFKAVLFLFERQQPAFVDAFDNRARELGLPEAFSAPLRDHADLNADYDHEDISRDLMALEQIVDGEAAVVVKRNVALMVETMLQQEEQILAFHAKADLGVARLPETA